MQLDGLFSLAGSLALAGWLVLALAPSRWRLPRLLPGAAAAALAVLYTALIAAFWAQGSGDFNSLEGVGTLFQHRGLLLAGWVHYLAFDLLIGVWEREEAERIGLNRWGLLPCLLLTFLFGPIGWLAFLAIRHFRLRTARLAAAV